MGQGLYAWPGGFGAGGGGRDSRRHVAHSRELKARAAELMQ